jgi:hypothetical protein
MAVDPSFEKHNTGFAIKFLLARQTNGAAVELPSEQATIPALRRANNFSFHP